MDLGKSRRNESVHGHDAHIASVEDIEKRAREIAEIEDRTEVTEQDRERARLELSGDDVPVTSDTEPRVKRQVSRNPAEPAGKAGAKAPERHAQDEQAYEEKETLQGVEDAEHERIVRGHREKDPGRENART